MANVYLIQLYARVKGSNESFQKGEIMYGFKTIGKAFEEIERLETEKCPDDYLEFEFHIVKTEIY